MTTFDARRTPMNGRVAAEHLADHAQDRPLVTGTPAQVSVPVADLLRRPNGPRDRQLLLGDTVTLYETRAGWCFVQADKDGYVGYLSATQIAQVPDTATHWVNAPASHAYQEANFKSPDCLALSFGSRVTVQEIAGRFAKTNLGFIPMQHLRRLDDLASDPVDVAQQFLGTPYLWGGNSRWGIDCSGLVQAAYLACGRPCPGDSDQQEAEVRQAYLPNDGYRRGDLLFWKGHVALVVDADRLIHANVHHMAVAFEEIDAAIARIAEQGDGPVTAHRRPAP
ncbi:C40 family peptidase [Epibacterium ulvae]|uniref:C40 family peptidase n=1 Tax=Epibacterium ulvae TaxID=1156985 RepID=UPI001BFCC750|nr:C40 family peptidase [Epibacterium ulvae]MBT8153306.1 C40 family peptidase [Epibacterium ulvae]